jgi:hemoglobin-like flavoprotein
MKLIENFEENRYEPEDIQMIVHFYDQMFEHHKIMKKYYEDMKNERSD